MTPQRAIQPRMNGHLVLWAITSALAGFLFGFDTVVISGAEQTIQGLWGLSAGVHGIAMAAALYGTVVGSLTGGWPAAFIMSRIFWLSGSRLIRLPSSSDRDLSLCEPLWSLAS